MNGLRKVAIIGCGYVGSTIAYALMIKGLCNEIRLIDSNREKASAEAFDIRHGIPYMGMCNIAQGNYEDIANSDLVIVTAGRNRRPGESRLDLATDNVKIGFEISRKIKQFYTSGVVLIVANPVDILTAKYTEWLALPPGRVFGTGCILDSSRLTNVLADYMKINPEAINAQVIGEHGNSQIVLWSRALIAGTPIEDMAVTLGLNFDDDFKIGVEKEVKDMGSLIIKGKQRTHYGIATCVCYLADAILNKRATIVSVSTVLHGEYGVNDVALSLPCIVNANGVERTLPDRLSDVEHSQFIESSEVLKCFLHNYFSMHLSSVK